MEQADGAHPDELLARLGAELARTVPPAVHSWVIVRGGQVVRAWAATGGGPVDPGDLDRQLAAAAERAVAQVATALAELADTDVDQQRVTPLQIVRTAMVFATQVLEWAGVPAVARDRFAEERFPHDLYGLDPSSLAAIADGLGPLGLAWGAAKAAAHRARHASAPEH